MQIVVWKQEHRYSQRHLSDDGVKTLCGTRINQFDTLTHRDFIADDRVTCKECGNRLKASDGFTASLKELFKA